MTVTAVDPTPASPDPGRNGANGANRANGRGGQPARTELAAFLRSRRERLTPGDVGLAPGFRRRTPGLRREEVAQLAGIGVTWYTWLEQGRPINASTQVLDAIARTLRLDAAERLHLHRLVAGPDAADDPERLGQVDHRLAPEIQSVLDGIERFPACVYSARFDLLAWNQVYAALFPTLVATPAERRNALWHILTAPGCCCRFVNRGAEIPRMVATFRGAFARHVGDPAWTGLVEELVEASPEFAELWAGHDVALPDTSHKVYEHHVVGEIRLTVTSMHLTGTPEARMMVYTPADDATATGVAWLAEHPEAPLCKHHAEA